MTTPKPASPRLPSSLLRRRIFFALSLLLLLCGSAATASATNVRFGSASYTISGSTATLAMTNLQNYATGGTSGTLHMELWALSSSYSGQGTVSGYKLAQYTVGQLAGGRGYSTISSGTVSCITPPNGTYYMTMFVTEYTGTTSLNDGFVFDNYLTINTATYGAPTQSQNASSYQFSTAVSVGGGYYYDTSVGYIYPLGSSFLYDYTFNQYFYVNPAGDFTTGVYMYDFRRSSWTYTVKAYWPSVYFFNGIGWQNAGFY